MSLVHNLKTAVCPFKDLWHHKCRLKKRHSTNRRLRVADGKRVLGEHREQHRRPQNEYEVPADLGRQAPCLWHMRSRIIHSINRTYHWGLAVWLLFFLPSLRELSHQALHEVSELTVDGQ